MIDQDIPKAKAKKAVVESDKDRQSLKSFYAGGDIELSDYDMVFNVSKMSQSEIVEAIRSVIRVKVNA